MTEDLQTALRDETGEPDSEDREMEEADAAYQKELGSDMADVAEPKKEETAEQNQRILAALGFKRYEDAGVVKYNIRVLDIKIGVTFNETNPLGKIWAYKIPEGDGEKKFLKNGELKDHPLMQKYGAIKEGKEPVPETSVTGKILEKRGKAIKVEITENGETKEIFFGQGAIKKDSNGYFVPAGFLKATKEHEAKMTVPRNIRLPDYEKEITKVPVADTTKKEDEPKEKGELPKKSDELAKTDLQPTDKSTLAEVIKPAETIKITVTQEIPTFVGTDGLLYNLHPGYRIEIPKENAETLIKRGVVVRLVEEQQPTVAELIAKYLDILAQTTIAVKQDDRIADRAKGYGTKFVYDDVVKELRKGKGGNREEQA